MLDVAAIRLAEDQEAAVLRVPHIEGSFADTARSGEEAVVATRTKIRVVRWGRQREVLHAAAEVLDRVVLREPVEVAVDEDLAERVDVRVLGGKVVAGAGEPAAVGGRLVAQDLAGAGIGDVEPVEAVFRLLGEQEGVDVDDVLAPRDIVAELHGAQCAAPGIVGRAPPPELRADVGDEQVRPAHGQHHGRADALTRAVAGRDDDRRRAGRGVDPADRARLPIEDIGRAIRPTDEILGVLDAAPRDARYEGGAHVSGAVELVQPRGDPLPEWRHLGERHIRLFRSPQGRPGVPKHRERLFRVVGDECPLDHLVRQLLRGREGFLALVDPGDGRLGPARRDVDQQAQHQDDAQESEECHRRPTLRFPLRDPGGDAPVLTATSRDEVREPVGQAAERVADRIPGAQGARADE